jgi:hypothetical protein
MLSRYAHQQPNNYTSRHLVPNKTQHIPKHAQQARPTPGFRGRQQHFFSAISSNKVIDDILPFTVLGLLVCVRYKLLNLKLLHFLSSAGGIENTDFLSLD